MSHVLVDLVRFLAVTGAMALAGVGVTVCLRVPFDATMRLLMGPAFGQALWAIVLGSSVALGFPVRACARWLWVGTLLLAGGGAWQLRRSASHSTRDDLGRPQWLIPACLMLLPVLVLGPYFWYGLAEYPGSGLPDGWAYVAYGQYLWDFADGTEGGLAPIYQYATTVSSTRNIASAQMGVLALVQHAGDVQTGFGLLLAVGLAAYGGAVAAFCRRSTLGVMATLVTVVATVMSGWILDVVWANNLDNLVALVYGPALAVVSLWPRPESTGWWLAAAWLSSGVLHTYPEMGVVVLGCAALSAGVRVASDATARRAWSVPALAALLLLLVCMPPVRGLVALLLQHGVAATATADPRPGEGMFLGLITARHVLAGWWALGSEHGYERLLLPRSAIALVLLVLVGVGIDQMRRGRERASLIWLAIPLGLAPFFAAVEGYAYGAYKAILMGWWFQVFVAVRGAMRLTLPNRRTRVAAAAWLVIIALPGAAVARLLFAPVSRSFRMPRPASMAVFRQVQDIEALVGPNPLLIAVLDEEASEWAVYYLRRLTTKVLTRDRYMLPKSSALERSQPVDAGVIRWVLTDGSGASSSAIGTDWTRRWSAGPYALWETPPGGGRAMEPAFSLP